MILTFSWVKKLTSQLRIHVADNLEVSQNSLHMMMLLITLVLELFGQDFLYMSKQNIQVFHFLDALTMHFKTSICSHSMCVTMELQSLLNLNVGELFPEVLLPGV